MTLISSNWSFRNSTESNYIFKFLAYKLKSDYWKLYSVFQLKWLYWLACKLWERKKMQIGTSQRSFRREKKVGIKVSLRSWKNVTPAGGKVWTLTSLMTARIAPSIFALKILVLYFCLPLRFFYILGNVFFDIIFLFILIKIWSKCTDFLQVWENNYEKRSYFEAQKY